MCYWVRSSARSGCVGLIQHGQIRDEAVSTPADASWPGASASLGEQELCERAEPDDQRTRTDCKGAGKEPRRSRRRPEVADQEQDAG